MSFTVKLPTKAYSKKFLEDLCGNPVNLRKIPTLNERFVDCLKKEVYSKNNASYLKFSHYTEVVSIRISDDSFYRYGWELEKDDIIKLNNEIERIIKSYSRSYLSIHAAFGIPISKSIRKFQETFSLPEDVFPSATIIKDFQRHGTTHETNLMIDFSELTKKIFLENLSKTLDT